MYKLQRAIRNNVVLILVVIAATAIVDIRLFKAIIGIIILIAIPAFLISILKSMRNNRKMRDGVKASPEISQLPIIAIMKEAYWLVKNQYKNFLKMFFPHIVLSIIALLYIMWHGIFYTLYIIYNPGPGTFLFTLALLYTYSAAAISWHRFVLRNENINYEESFLLSYKEAFKYLGFLLCIAFIPDISNYLTYVVRLVLEKFSTPDTYIISSASIAFSLIAILIISRVSLILPAIALGNKNITLGDVWSATSLNKLRLLLLSIFCAFLILLPVILLKMIGVNYTLLIYAIAIGSLMLLTPFALTCLSLSYKHFFDNNNNSLEHVAVT